MASTKACSSCGNQIPADARFCPQCGTAQAVRCAACGHANAAGSKFCAQCGAKLGAAAAPAALPCAGRTVRSIGGTGAARCPRRNRRAASAHCHVLRSGRLDGALHQARSGRLARGDRGLSPMHRRRRHAAGRLRRQIYGRRRADLFRLSGGARGRRRKCRARCAGADRGGNAAVCRGRPSNPHRHRHGAGRGRRTGRRRRSARAQCRRRDAEPRGPAAVGRGAEHRGDRRDDAAAGRRPVRL